MQQSIVHPHPSVWGSTGNSVGSVSCFYLPGSPAVQVKCGSFVWKKNSRVHVSKQYENLHTSILGSAKRLKRTTKPFQKHVQQRILQQKTGVLYKVHISVFEIGISLDVPESCGGN